MSSIFFSFQLNLVTIMSTNSFLFSALMSSSSFSSSVITKINAAAMMSLFLCVNGPWLNSLLNYIIIWFSNLVALSEAFFNFVKEWSFIIFGTSNFKPKSTRLHRVNDHFFWHTFPRMKNLLNYFLWKYRLHVTWKL